jgi:hypothetical protein
MTPEEWDRCTDPEDMLGSLGDGASLRKLRLFTIACCQGAWSSHYAERCHKLLLLAERHADGRATAAELAGARRIAYPEGLLWTIGPNPAEAAAAVLRSLPVRGGGKRKQAGCLREIFDNPFRPPRTLDPAVLGWDGGGARRLAKAIYDGRRFEDLPILADLLEEAGCTDAALLGHLRGPGPHMLGCHALDLALGRR